MRTCAASALLAVMLSLALPARGHEGWGIVVHGRLGVVVADIPGNTIWRIHGGRVEALIRDVHSHALVLGGDGAIYGTDADPAGADMSVWRVDGSGRFSHLLPPKTDSPLGMQSFLITGDGTIYSANRYDHRRPSVVLLRRGRDGTIARVAPFRAIDGMAEAADGALVVVDGDALRVVSAHGAVAALTGPLTKPRWGEELLGVSSVRGGAVHVADHAGRRVVRVALQTGAIEEVHRSGWLWAPSGVEATGGALYVLEHLRPPLSLLGDLQLGPYLRVREIRGGASNTLATVWGRQTLKAGLAAAVLAAIAGAATRKRGTRAR